MEVLLFTRFPEPGRVKTRLIPALGENAAAELHRRMAERMHAVLVGVNSRWEARICYTGATQTEMQDWLGNDLPMEEQSTGDLGQRLHSAMTASFQRGHEQVIVIGSDCPDLRVTHIEEAFAAFDNHPLVIGPATDGGYYLLGQRDQVTPELFQDIQWGTANVLQQTLQRAEISGLSSVLLDPLPDVDLSSDLDIARRCRLID